VFSGKRVAGINVNAELGTFCKVDAPMDAKNCQFFYHNSPDFTKSWITDNRGKPIAHLVYPFFFNFTDIQTSVSASHHWHCLHFHFIIVFENEEIFTGRRDVAYGTNPKNQVTTEGKQNPHSLDGF
jgi:hypothetical protein